MQLSDFIYKNKASILILGLILLIILFIAGIFLIDRDIAKPQALRTGYSESLLSLRGEITAIGNKDPQIRGNGAYDRLNTNLDIVANESSSDSDRYEALKESFVFFYGLYQETSDNKLYPVNQDFQDFAKRYFPKHYDEVDFTYFCQDPVCADSETPQEILEIVDELKKSDMPERIAETTANDILNDSYLSEKDKELKVENYIISISILRGYDDFSPSKINQKIADDILNFVKNKYPEEYRKIGTGEI